MRKLFIGLAAVAALALAAPVALASSASAATTGTGTYHQDVFVDGVKMFTHDGTASYTCNADGTVGFTFQGDDTSAVGDGHGTGLINGTTLVFSGARVSDGYTYSASGTFTDLASGAWTSTGQHDSAGSTGVFVAGTYTGIPDCAADPVVPVGNHGQCVSGATKAGIKGKALAEVAKVVTLVGPYGSTTCPTV